METSEEMARAIAKVEGIVSGFREKQRVRDAVKRGAIAERQEAIKKETMARLARQVERINSLGVFEMKVLDHGEAAVFGDFMLSDDRMILSIPDDKLPEDYHEGGIKETVSVYLNNYVLEDTESFAIFISALVELRNNQIEENKETVRRLREHEALTDRINELEKQIVSIKKLYRNFSIIRHVGNDDETMTAHKEAVDDAIFYGYEVISSQVLTINDKLCYVTSIQYPSAVFTAESEIREQRNSSRRKSTL